MSILLWGLAIIGGVGVVILVGFFILEALAERAQRSGKNWFQ